MGIQQCLDAACSTAKASASAAQESATSAATSTTNAHTDMLSARAAANIASDKAAEVKGYVIPTEATYSKEEIDNNFATLGNLIWRNKAKNEAINLHLT